ncbi:hypothetical protein F4804DRAFT_338730 [Jackrogersella minutella]|nr:hypothetical protein F4804DRAFT_338730 [Jackrogersella minutella]
MSSISRDENMMARVPGPSGAPVTDWNAIQLEDILPRRGFVFPENHKIFNSEQDELVIKKAIEVAAPILSQRQVDAVLATIVFDAIDTADQYKTTTHHFDAIIEGMRKQHRWTESVPDGVFPHLMVKIFQARRLYVSLTRICGIPYEDHDQKYGKLAMAIDEWCGTRPAEEAEAKYASMPDYKINRKVDKMMKRASEEAMLTYQSYSDFDKKASHSAKDVKGKKPVKVERIDENNDEDDLGDENAPWIPWRQLWYGNKGKRPDPNDESAPWVHPPSFYETELDMFGDDASITNPLLRPW